MNTWIAAYIAFGLCFGWFTHSRQHLFSEGPARPAQAGQASGQHVRLAWVLVCGGLWPIMALTGLYSLWRLARLPRER